MARAPPEPDDGGSLAGSGDGGGVRLKWISVRWWRREAVRAPLEPDGGNPQRAVEAAGAYGSNGLASGGGGGRQLRPPELDGGVGDGGGRGERHDSSVGVGYPCNGARKEKRKKGREKGNIWIVGLGSNGYRW